MTICSTGPCWTESTLISNNFTRQSAAIFNNRYIVGGQNPNTGNAVIQYSTDGINWTVIDLGYFAGYGVQQFAVSDTKIMGMVNPERHVLSSDGVNWTSHLHYPPAIGDQSLAYGNGYFVFRSQDSLAYSSDGINWNTTAGPNNAGLYMNRSLTYGGGKFVGAGSGGFCYTSSVITPMTLVNTASTATYVVYGNGAFVAIESGLGATNTVYRSTDGITWTITPNALPLSGGPQSFYNSIVFSQGAFIACKFDSNQLAVSEDGITWTLTSGSHLFDDEANNGQSALATDNFGKYIAINGFNAFAQLGQCPCAIAGDFWVRTTNVKMTNVKLGKYVVPPPPPACDAYWNNVTFLLSGNGPLNSTTVIDNGPLALPFATEWGTWTYTDAQNIYHPTSLIGTTSGALSTTIPAAYSNKSWTFEMWFYATSAALAGSGAGMSFLTDQYVNYAIMSRGSANGGNNELGLVFLFTSSWYAASGPLPADAWTYLTITYEETGGAPGYGGTLRTFINGTLVNSQAFNSAPLTWEGQKVWIGPTANSFFTSNNYYFSDYRFTRGVARYTSSFTPPAAALPTIACP